MISSSRPLCKVACSLVPVSFTGSSSTSTFSQNPQKVSVWKEARLVNGKKRGGIVVCDASLFPVDPWAPTIDSQSIASQLFAFSLFPYIGFLYFITKSKSAPKLTLFGFYFLLAFVGATTKVQYGTSLSNVDWLHGGAESLLTLTNLFIVLGLRQALRNNSKDTQKPAIKNEEKSSV
ncbi:hypothetical protein JCGZ_20473 [Jatropha curcas]|uniref:DUF3593 domain-containing protein n=1 Tax=Jatropha curcas TaxID=180498 RepID=A0A067JN69_JATCU|nr:hypothetical protein JCGZ_20473 [Jatropha curcas]